MAVPKFKHSKSRKRMRRAHDAILAVPTVPCGNCGLQIPQHRICPDCGHYRTHKGKGRTRLVIAQSEE